MKRHKLDMSEYKYSRQRVLVFVPAIVAYFQYEGANFVSKPKLDLQRRRWQFSVTRFNFRGAREGCKLTAQRCRVVGNLNDSQTVQLPSFERGE